MKVLVTSESFDKLSRKSIQKLQDTGFKAHGNERGRLLNEEETVEAIQGVDAIILGTEAFNRNVINHAGKLKVVSCHGVGLDKIDMEYLKEKDIALQIARNADTNSVADHTIGLMLSLCHNTARSDANVHSHAWKKPITKDLHQSTVDTLRLGTIGKAVARRLKGFDYHILAFDSYYDEAFIQEYGIREADMSEIASSSDFLTLHLPALTEFSPLLDAKVLFKMKKGAVIINTARAKLIDQQALYDALHNGQFHDYGSDVYYMEPSFDKELIACENTVLIPHIAASSEGAINRISDIVVDHVLAYFGCQQPLGN